MPGCCLGFLKPVIFAKQAGQLGGNAQIAGCLGGCNFACRQCRRIGIGICDNLVDRHAGNIRRTLAVFWAGSCQITSPDVVLILGTNGLAQSKD